ncbi:MAG: sulfotransferase [Caulobacterales bacterium]
MQDSRKASWTPPARPEWVARVNDEGRSLDLKGVIPLDENSLLETAMKNTGLSDFGSDPWREPFSVFVKSLDEDAELNLMGRILTRTDILMWLEARLRIENEYKLHPEIENVEIKQPLWVFGQGRSGTTYLQRLLSLDPGNRTTPQWECMFPVPFTDADGVDRRYERGQARATQWARVTPEIDSMHEFNADEPMETIYVESFTFRNTYWQNILGMTNSFNAYMASESLLPGFQYLKRVYKYLEWTNPGRQWVVKSPASISHLPEVLKVFPDARLVWAHRDPVKTMGSAVSLVSTLCWIRSDRRFAAGTFDSVTDQPTVARLLNGPIDWLAQGVIDENRLCNVQYPDLIRDPVGTVAKIYQFYGLPFTDAAKKAITDYGNAHPRTNRPAHTYSSGADEQVQKERAVFKRYQDYFQVPNE